MNSIKDKDIKRFTKLSLEKRKKIVDSFKLQAPGKIPVLVGRAETKNTPKILKHKFIVPEETTFHRFIYECRKHMEMVDPSASLFFFLEGGFTPQGSSMMGELHHKYASDDNILYLVYTTESMFG